MTVFLCAALLFLVDFFFVFVLPQGFVNLYIIHLLILLMNFNVSYRIFFSGSISDTKTG